MEYVQERITTLHQLTSGPVGVDGLEETLERTAIIVPMTDREHESPAATGVLSALETLEPRPQRVVVPVRAEQTAIDPLREWLKSFDLPLEVLWCTAPGVTKVLERQDLDGPLGKGRDIWLALGAVLDGPGEQPDSLVIHDADATSFSADDVAKLLHPIAAGYQFSKGYYARVENDQLYGRLCRLFYTPLIEALSQDHDAPLLEYLGAFRYALSGEVAMTADLARELRPPRTWGLEVATLGDTFEQAGFTGTAQVDLGVHRHDHRSVGGDGGLEGMSQAVGATLLSVLTTGGVDVESDRVQESYIATANRLIEQYELDASFNDLSFDAESERAQVHRYAEALNSTVTVDRLPEWSVAPIDGREIWQHARPWDESREATGAVTGATLAEPSVED